MFLIRQFVFRVISEGMQYLVVTMCNDDCNSYIMITMYYRAGNRDLVPVFLSFVVSIMKSVGLLNE